MVSPRTVKEKLGRPEAIRGTGGPHIQPHTFHLKQEVATGFLCGCGSLFLSCSAANSRTDDPVCSQLFCNETV